jgi:3-dehydroquinate dehydratase/shikimate dehydrogenase
MVTSRTYQRSEALAEAIGGKAIPWSSRYDIQPHVIVNGSPVGMFPDLDSSPYDAAKLNEGQLVFDTVYNPERTLLLKSAMAAGCTGRVTPHSEGPVRNVPCFSY